MHTYPAQINPVIEIGRCSKPTKFVEVKQGNIVATWCEDGHFVTGRIFVGADASQKAAALASRMKRWIELQHDRP
jgi:hypothetical protein